VLLKEISDMPLPSPYSQCGPVFSPWAVICISCVFLPVFLGIRGCGFVECLHDDIRFCIALSYQSLLLPICSISGSWLLPLFSASISVVSMSISPLLMCSQIECISVFTPVMLPKSNCLEYFVRGLECSDLYFCNRMHT
jgi:hypothetical protein